MAIARINESASFSSGTTTTEASPATSLTAGNRFVVGVRWNGTGASISSIVDTAGNTFVHLKTFAPSGSTLALYVVDDCLGHASNVVTVTFSAGVSFKGICTAQYSGSADYELLGVIWGSSSATLVTCFGTLTLDDALIVETWQINATGTTLTAGTDMTKVVEDASTVQMLLEAIITSPTTITPSGSSSSATAKSTIAAVWVPSVSGEGSPGGSPSAGGREHSYVF